MIGALRSVFCESNVLSIVVTFARLPMFPCIYDVHKSFLRYRKLLAATVEWYVFNLRSSFFFRFDDKPFPREKQNVKRDGTIGSDHRLYVFEVFNPCSFASRTIR